MTNIFLAVDANNTNLAAIDFACYLAKLNHSKLAVMVAEGAFANKEPQPGRKVYAAGWEQEDKEMLFPERVQLLKDFCSNKGVDTVVFIPESSPREAIIEESRYADLLIIDAASFGDKMEGLPTRFARKILKLAECPVVIAPESFGEIDEIVFTYDGSASSVFAMKQFAYLFPQFDDKKVTLLHIDDENEGGDTDRLRVGKWLQHHYSSIGFDSRTGSVTPELLSYLFLRRNIFIVMGAYGRTALSQYLHHSHANLLVRTITQPFFITHH